MTLHTSTAPLQYGAVIGEGGMGVVIEARQAHLERTIAVKRLHREHSNSRSVRALLAEARITGAVAHPCVVPVHDLGIGDDGQPEIRLKRIEGRPWTHLLRDPGLLMQLHNPDDILAFHVRVLIRVCEAVHAAHARSIIHRDLKPGNIMIGKLGEVYVLDWGLAATLDPAADPRLPRPSENGGGTPQYMAPEMVSRTFGELGPWSDVYLLGGLLFYILNGRAPHPGATSWNMLVEACEKQVPVPDNGPKELVGLCEKALRRLPTQRLASADALRNGLQTWLDHRPSTTLCEEGLYNAELLADDIRQKRSVDAHFGAATFAFRQALQEWPSNPSAQHGLDRLVRTMTDHCLAHDRVSDAERALANLSSAPRDLARRVRRARRRNAVGLSDRAEQVMVWGALVGVTLVGTAAALWLVGPPGVAFAVAGLGSLAAHLGARTAL